jgi:hypothetical protein
MVIQGIYPDQAGAYMKIFSVTLILCGICLFCPEGNAAEWVRYISDKHGNEWLYDRESTSFKSQNIVSVWGKGIYSKDGIQQEITERTKAKLPTEGLDELSYLLERFEINCKTSEFDVYERGFYNKAGKILHSYATPKKRSHWYAINPESKMDALYRSVCKVQPKEAQKKTW